MTQIRLIPPTALMSGHLPYQVRTKEVSNVPLNKGDKGELNVVAGFQTDQIIMRADLKVGPYELYFFYLGLAV